MRVGYACQIAGYRGFSFKNCRLATATSEKLQETARHNIRILEKMIDYNIENGIRLFRISSDIIPLASHPEVGFDWIPLYAEQLRALGERVLAYGMRVSMHPGQYTVLNSPSAEVVAKSVADLSYHNHFLDAMKLPPSHKIILHLGGVYGDKEHALARFIQNAEKLDEKTRRRLVLENDDRQYTISDVLSVCHALSMPAVFDTLHHQCNPVEGWGLTRCIEACHPTWKAYDGVQKIHYSQQRIGGKRGSHSESIFTHPWSLSAPYFTELDVMLEVKDKNLSALKCLLLANPEQSKVLKTWQLYRYLILRYSPELFGTLSAESNRGVDPLPFFQWIEQAMLTNPTSESCKIAAEQMSEHLRDHTERNKVQKQILKFANGELRFTTLLSSIHRAAESELCLPLLNSYCFWEGWS